MSEKIEKALTILLLATSIKLVEDGEKVKKRKKRSVWIKPWLKNRIRTSAYQNIFQELRLKDNEEFRRYLRINRNLSGTNTYLLFLYLFIYVKNYRGKYFYSSQDPYYVMMHLLDFFYYGKLILY